jgi:hypothetical protein
MNLAIQLDFINDMYESSELFIEAINSPAISDDDLFSGIHTEYVQDGIIQRDTDILVEYYDDIDDAYGFGVVKSWRKDTYIGEEDVERAYIVRNNGGSTYARFEHISEICEVNEYDYQQQILPVVQYPVTTETTETNGELINSNLFVLPAFSSKFGKVSQ